MGSKHLNVPLARAPSEAKLQDDLLFLLEPSQNLKKPITQEIGRHKKSLLARADNK